MDVSYTGLHQTPDKIVEAVVQEGAHVLGLSILSGAHMTLVPLILSMIREQGLDELVVMVGGTIPTEDIPELRRLGVSGVFTPGSSTEAIIDFIRGACDQADPAPGMNEEAL